MSLFSVTLVLFLIMDPIGNLSAFHSMVKELDPRRQYWIIFREMLIALAAMLFFNYLGEFIFDFLGLSETTVRLSSGIILFLIAIKILFTAADSPRANLPKGEPFIFPLAIPLIAGPALMATIMLYAHLEQLQSVMLAAIFIAWLLSFLIFLSAGPIKLVGVQRFMEGLLLFWATQPNPA
jgi:multiple antibiotic resistance protein